MRTMTTQDEVLMGLNRRVVRLKIEVRDTSGTWHDITALDGVCFARSAEWGMTLDDQGLMATIDMFWWRFEDNMSFVVTGSRYSGLIGLNQEVKIYTAVMPEETQAPSTWMEMFHGTILRIDMGSGDGTVKLECRDKITDLLTYRWHEADATYGSSGGTNMETVIQNIMNDTLGAFAPTLYTPTSPGFAITEYNLEPKALIEAIRQLYLLIGWDCRVMWDDGTSAWRLTLYEPDRTTTTTQWTFSADQYQTFDAFEINVDSIRNYIVVYYDDGTRANGTDIQLQSQTASDATSINKYGRRWMELTEDPAKGIDTSGEASTLANNILSDLKDPVLSFGVQVGYFPFVQLNDFYEFEPENQRFTTSQDLAVYGFRHAVSYEGGAVTFLTCTGQPKSGMAIWTARQAGAVSPTHNTATPPTPTVSATSTPLGAIFNADWPKTGQWDTIEYHVSTTNGFTPDATTLAQSGRELAFYYADTSRTARYIKAIVKDRTGNQSAASTQATFTATGVSNSMMSDGMQRGVGVSPSSDQTGITTSPTKVAFDTVDFGYSSMFSNGTDAIQAQQNGMYRVTAQIIPGSTEATTWSAQIIHDTDGEVASTGTYPGDTPLQLDALVDMTTGDTITIQITFTGATVDIESTNTRWAVMPTTVSP